MEYQVPQFIEVEDKIFGPFTLKQFIYVAGGAGLCAIFILYVHPLMFGIILSIPAAALAGALAFYKPNGKPFVDMLDAGLKYYLGGRLFLWHREPKVGEEPKVGPAAAAAAPERAQMGLSRGKLRDLAWSLDIKDNEAKEESVILPDHFSAPRT